MKAHVTHPLAAVVLGCFLPPALAQATAQATSPPAVSSTNGATMPPAAPPGAATMPAAVSPPPRTPMAQRLVAEFGDFAGSTENARALISGLRSGDPITLTATPGSSGANATFSSPTRPLSYGNIRIALSLARAQLAREGIAQPTPQQLQAALVGNAAGTSPAPDGILTRRAAGLGWGRIAHAMGMKLGPTVSGHDSQPATTTGTRAHVEHRDQPSRQYRTIMTAARSGDALGSGHRHATAATPRVVTAAGSTQAGGHHGAGHATTNTAANGAAGMGRAPDAPKQGGHGKS